MIVLAEKMHQVLQEGGHGGNISLDTFRINLDYSNDDLIGKVDYRWHNGYNFFHTAYVGYNLDDAQLRVGLNRVPFGIGNWGPANSWFFDQHYYVGLSDDMDVGIKYSKTFESWSLDLAYYVGSEPNWRGSNSDGARYSFDILDTGPGTYKENGQVNARLVKKIVTGDLESNIGVSLQYGKLDGNDTEDADAFAGSLHMKSSYNQWGLKAQLTAYDYDSHNDIMTGGFFDYTTQIASKGWIPSLAVNYLWNVDSIDWIDSINFYNDYSILIKEGRNASGEFSDCALNVLGAAVAKGNWYIYLDWAYSDGNEFVSEQPYNTLGENQGNDWNSRYNINLGYYV